MSFAFWFSLPALSEAQTRQAVASGTMKPGEAAPAVPAPSCKDLMGVALMAHIEYDLILRGLQHAVQCHCKLYHAKVRRQMSTGFRDIFQQKAADLLTKLFYLLFIQLF